MSNPCKVIDDYYRSINESNKYESIFKLYTTNMFGGTRSSYAFQTSSGSFGLTCEHGISTLGFARLTINDFESTFSFSATNITPFQSTNLNGIMWIDTIATRTAVHFPTPLLKKV